MVVKILVKSGRRYVGKNDLIPGNKAITSFYVSNLQADINVVMLKKSFWRFEKLTDVYIPGLEG